MTHDLKAPESKVEMQVVVRDKFGNVKYQGPLVMKVEKKETESGGDSFDSREKRGG